MAGFHLTGDAHDIFMLASWLELKLDELDSYFEPRLETLALELTIYSLGLDIDTDIERVWLVSPYEELRARLEDELEDVVSHLAGRQAEVQEKGQPSMKRWSVRAVRPKPA